MDSDRDNLLWKTKDKGTSENGNGSISWEEQSLLCFPNYEHFRSFGSKHSASLSVGDKAFSHACCFWTYVSTLSLTLLSFMHLFWYLWAILSMSCFPTVSHISVCSYFDSSLKSLQIYIKKILSVNGIMKEDCTLIELFSTAVSLPQFQGLLNFLFYHLLAKMMTDENLWTEYQSFPLKKIDWSTIWSCRRRHKAVSS